LKLERNAGSLIVRWLKKSLYAFVCIYVMVYIKNMNTTSMQLTLITIAEPNRFNIVELLKQGPRSVSEIVQALNIGQPQVSRHLRILSEAGLVRVRSKAQQRIYSLEARPFQELDEWFDSFSILWEERLDNFEDNMLDYDYKRKENV
jgi:DNA-binding transcriptional ArsR family regulator